MFNHLRLDPTRPAMRVAFLALCGCLALIAGASLLLTGCAATLQASIGDRTAICSFLGPVCRKLTPGGEGQSYLRYVNSGARWSQYRKVIVDPVIIVSSAESQIPPAAAQHLANYFDAALKEKLGTRFKLTDQPGAGVMRIQVALTDARAATPGLRTITMAVPQARTLSTVGYLATGSFPFVGAAEGAAKVLDSRSGELLAALADRQVGGGHIKAAAQWTLGDAENAINLWAERAANQLYAWTSGAQAPR
ncbi:DUF3313 domain-containing protein [Candidatus Thiodictyon syntrophicum]|jgi:hypothetical protein|uniref:DUF3313 domain-containing protein n=1 Tax=Candidatus Thiodictyon syntrophicum TaxID=1166950 RepID=A0A2K8U4R1_9GAMM|nr:DUF3313 domain-containing protein [Candidatus Thiodictyon syntrophicum]AUB80525.1 hypothetical protein THSYN_05885 [Candidatus Thiodictyon syntrophicum]